jgi:hypothetical protein
MYPGSPCPKCNGGIFRFIELQKDDSREPDAEPAPWRQHELKCWPSTFEALIARRKRFEYRKNDRGFRLHDILLLREWEPDARPDCPAGYTGRSARYVVTYIISGPRFGVPEGYCVMSVDEENCG